jgi:hypothetical protein
VAELNTGASISSTHFASEDLEVSHMKKKFLLSPPLFGFAVATRAILGMGIGLLVADKIPRDRRRAIGLTLISVGAATTLPVARALFASRLAPTHS